MGFVIGAIFRHGPTWTATLMRFLSPAHKALALNPAKEQKLWGYLKIFVAIAGVRYGIEIQDVQVPELVHLQPAFMADTFASVIRGERRIALFTARAAYTAVVIVAHLATAKPFMQLQTHAVTVHRAGLLWAVFAFRVIAIRS